MSMTFGSPLEGVTYTERPAAYAVVRGENGTVATVELVDKIGEATQFFYAAEEDCHFQMLGVFFLAEFPDEPDDQGEHELFWLPLAEVAGAFFHESHAWAARQGLKTSAEERKP